MICTFSEWPIAHTNYTDILRIAVLIQGTTNFNRAMKVFWELDLNLEDSSLNLTPHETSGMTLGQSHLPAVIVVRTKSREELCTSP